VPQPVEQVDNVLPAVVLRPIAMAITKPSRQPDTAAADGWQPRKWTLQRIYSQLQASQTPAPAAR